MPAAYIRELLEHVRRDLCELCDLLHHARALDDLTVNQLAQAIGLADTAHRALLSAMKARHTEGPQA